MRKLLLTVFAILLSISATAYARNAIDEIPVITREEGFVSSENVTHTQKYENLSLYTLKPLWASSEAYIYEISYPDGSTAIRYHGRITSAGYLNLNRIVASRDILELSSHGGELAAGLSIGSMIKDKNIKVVVHEGAICLSACAYALIAGSDYEIYGLVGFHYPYIGHLDLTMPFEEFYEDSGLVNIRLMRYLSKMDYSSDLLKDIIMHAGMKDFIVFFYEDALLAYRGDLFKKVENKDTVYLSAQDIDDYYRRSDWMMRGTYDLTRD